MDTLLSFLNLNVIGSLGIGGAVGFAIRGLLDARKANEDQILIKVASEALSKLAKNRKPNQDQLDAAAAAAAAEEAQIKALQAKAASLLS
jgi:hypothetical protein